MTPDTSTSKPRKGRDRPFPWTCGNCLKDEVYPETMPYAIDVKHDGQLYHLEIPEISIPKCRACGELIFSSSEDDQILQALRARVRLLTPEQIRGGREALGLKAKELADRLGVAPETISRWENGGLVQSRAMDNFLRVFFAVPGVRSVLRGAEQDSNLGTAISPEAQKDAERRQLDCEIQGTVEEWEAMSAQAVCLSKALEEAFRRTYTLMRKCLKDAAPSRPGS
jgi:putative zinc finger/helix-turn-helix YgiT family protein